jgi:N4-gp56 family major capsid protein
MSTTSMSGLSNVTRAHFDAQQLKYAEPILCVAKMGMERQLPKNRGDQVKYQRPVPLPAATTPLTEGVAPTGKAMTYEDVNVTTLQYGDFVEITDKVLDMAECPVLKDATKLCGEQRAETVELIVMGVIRGGTSVVYANGATRNAVNTVPTIGKLRGINQFLRRQRAKTITEFVKSTANQTTVAIKPCWVVVCHTDAQADLEQIAGWKSPEQYVGTTELLPCEIGSIGEFRFCASPLVPIWADAGGAKGAMKSTSGTSADVYPMIVMAQDCFGRTTLGGYSAEKLLISDAANISVANPLGQKGTVGWKQYFAAWIANNTWMTRLEHAITLL